jgi:hypothetical protein
MVLIYVVLATLVAFVGCSRPDAITSCAPAGASTPLCGFQNPEDLALLPGGRQVLVSEYGDSGARPGRIALLDLTSNERTILFAGGEPVAAGPWGASDCGGPPPKEFSPHGIHLSKRSDGALQLLVVNHGGRESVEMFEVIPDGSRVQLAWRGCATSQDDMFNDVVALPEGGFLVTRFGPKATSALRWALAKSVLFGSDTGWVYAWSQARGFSELPGTRSAGPNGIELSADGQKVFLNLTLASQVLRLDRRTGKVEARASVPQPDNSTWARDGRLIVASLRGTAGELMACSELEGGTCPVPFAVEALDPETLQGKTIFTGGPGVPAGAVTVALETDGALLLGTFAGDRIVSAKGAL